MKLLAAFVLLGITFVFASQQEEAIVGIAGVYSREYGMTEERLVLSRDLTYTFITKSDIGEDKETGVWKLSDGHVLLEAKKRGAVSKKPSKFQILALHADPLLRVVDESSSGAAQNDPRFFFWRRHEEANQQPQQQRP